MGFVAPRIIFLASLFMILNAGMLAGCGGKAVNENDPASLYQDAEEDISGSRYQIAIDKLRMIKNKFPYSSQSVESQLRIADVLFLQESFGDAALTYEAFRDLHPKHPKVGYAMFRIAKSHFNDIPSPISRDLTPATKAQVSYEDFLAKFPSAPESEEARKDLAETRKTLADKELYIANFYYKRDHDESAKGRFKKIIGLYPETDAAKEAKEKLEKLEKVAAAEKPAQSP